MASKQRTLRNIVHANGIGVHTAQKTRVALSPAPANTGIVFRRTDLAATPVEIPARVEFISQTSLSTSLTKNDVQISTTEHLLSALTGLGIDNAYVDLNSSEVPIMDGSANPFVFLIQSAGAEEQAEFKRYLRIKKPISVTENDRYVKLEPFDGFKISFTIQYEHPAFNNKNQSIVYNFSRTSYVREISRARTYGFLSDYEYIKKNNLALGASLNNTVVLDETKVMNEEGLRYSNECVKHKILDAIGDLSLLGYPIVGAFTGYKSGHELNNRLMQKLLSEPDAWEVIISP
jgi:UDP-3-O-[3-hydroxymyristoyl] N-acetylglucosamine deacetylase